MRPWRVLVLTALLVGLWLAVAPLVASVETTDAACRCVCWP